MLRTRICDLLRIDHPVVLGGMASHSNPALVAAVTRGGGLGILGVTVMAPEEQRAAVRRIRELTDGPFGLNHLLAFATEDRFAVTLEARPRVVSTAWAWAEQDLHPYFDRAHEAGALVMHMVSTVPEAVRAVGAGADIIVAQGTEGGGHVGWISTLPLVPQVVRAVAPVPVLAAGGIADGAGLAAALALGAEGVLLGTRFLATPEAPIPAGYKEAILASDGHNTLLTEVADIAFGRVWPGAMSRVIRNQFVERWVGREWEVRQRHHEIARGLRAARERDDAGESNLQMGQAAGLITEVAPAADIVREIVAQAERIIRSRLPSLLAD
ncbi:MAG TPA: nitronate monooxygenase family protein [bacterium]|nr:nitronate monooxygenase family protein [bacterium]